MIRCLPDKYIQIAKFLLSGGINTLASYAIYFLLVGWLHYVVAYSAAYVSGIVISYLINAKWVFKVQLNVKNFVLYPLVYVVQYLLGVLLIYVLVDNLGVNQLLAPLIVIVATLPVTFLLSRYVLNAGQNKP